MSIQPPPNITLSVMPASPPTIAMPPPLAGHAVISGGTAPIQQAPDDAAAEMIASDFANLAAGSRRRLKLPQCEEPPDWEELAHIADGCQTARPSRSMLPRHASSRWGFASLIAFIGASFLLDACGTRSQKADAGDIFASLKDTQDTTTFPVKAFAIGTSSRVRTPAAGPLSPSTESDLKREARLAALGRVRTAFFRKYPAARCVPRPGLDGPVEIDEQSSASRYELVHERGYNRYRFFLAWTYVQCMAPGKLGGAKGLQLFRLQNPRL